MTREEIATELFDVCNAFDLTDKEFSNIISTVERLVLSARKDEHNSMCECSPPCKRNQELESQLAKCKEEISE